MSDDAKPDMPPQPQTTKLEAIPLWASELTILVKRVSMNVDNVISAVDVLRDRVNAHDQRFADQDARASTLSGGVRGLSTSTAEHDAQLAQERAAREALAGKVDELTKTQELQLAILGRLDKVASNPLVKTVMTILGTALATWAASKGLK